jgi:predicted  nucleic acid-binding Zn-ribbon protein
MISESPKLFRLLHQVGWYQQKVESQGRSMFGVTRNWFGQGRVVGVWGGGTSPDNERIILSILFDSKTPLSELRDYLEGMISGNVTFKHINFSKDVLPVLESLKAGKDDDFVKLVDEAIKTLAPKLPNLPDVFDLPLEPPVVDFTRSRAPITSVASVPVSTPTFKWPPSLKDLEDPNCPLEIKLRARATGTTSEDNPLGAGFVKGKMRDQFQAQHKANKLQPEEIKLFLNHENEEVRVGARKALEDIGAPVAAPAKAVTLRGVTPLDTILPEPTPPAPETPSPTFDPELPARVKSLENMISERERAFSLAQTDYEERIGRLTGDCERLRSQLVAAEERYAEAARQLPQLGGQLSEAAARIGALRDEVNQLKTELETKDANLQSLKAQVQAYEDKIKAEQEARAQAPTPVDTLLLALKDNLRLKKEVLGEKEKEASSIHDTQNRRFIALRGEQALVFQSVSEEIGRLGSEMDMTIGEIGSKAAEAIAKRRNELEAEYKRQTPELESHSDILKDLLDNHPILNLLKSQGEAEIEKAKKPYLEKIERLKTDLEALQKKIGPRIIDQSKLVGELLEKLKVLRDKISEADKLPTYLEQWEKVIVGLREKINKASDYLEELVKNL